MQDLRLVGVHDDGEHLLLSGAGGEIFLLPIDEALRVAVSRSPLRRPTSSAPADGRRLSPREIQAHIRSGATAAEVAKESGIPLEQVQRYEGPVLAERNHIASQARRVEVSGPIPGSESYRNAFGDESATLDEMVSYRLAAFGIDPDSVTWDAWRRHDGTWTVTADFDPGLTGAANSVGEPTPAQWSFHPGRKALQNANRWAQQLSELEPLDGPVPARRLSAVADRPFDFETDAPEDTDPETSALGAPEAAGEPTGEDTDGLLEMLRSRRGQRLGLDEESDDQLATILGSHMPAAQPVSPDAGDRPDPAQPAAEAGGAVGSAGDTGAENEAAGNDAPAKVNTEATGPTDTEVSEGTADSSHGRVRRMPFLSLAPKHPQHEPDASSTQEARPGLRAASAPGKTAPDASPAGRVNPGAADDSGNGSATEAATKPSSEAGNAEAAARQDRKNAPKPKRSSVPSWDEIVFGTKGD